MKFTFLTSFSFQGYKATLNKNRDNPNPFHSKYFITLRSLMENYDYRLKQFYNFNYSTITNYDAIILVDNHTLGSSAIEDLDNYECSHADTDIFRLIALWLDIPVIFITNVSSHHFNKLEEFSSSKFTLVPNEKILANVLSTFDNNSKLLLVNSVRIFDDSYLKELTKACLRILDES